MSERFDVVAKIVAARTTRRRTLVGVGAFALGSLGILSVGHETEAANNDCTQCKKQCKRNNRKQGKKHKRNCSNKCNHKCRNKNN